MIHPNPGLAVLGLLALAFDGWAVARLLRRPGWAFRAASTRKGLWLGLIFVGIPVLNVGFFVALWYLAMVDSRVSDAQRAGTADPGERHAD